MAKKKNKKRKKKLTKAQRARISRRNLKKAHAARRRKSGGGSRRRKSTTRRRRKSSGILAYKASSKKKAMINALVAKGKPRHIATKIINRALRISSNPKVLKQRAAEAQMAAVAANYRSGGGYAAGMAQYVAKH